MENFTRVTCGVEIDLDLIDDGWTRNALELTEPAVLRETARLGREMTADEIAEFLYRADYEAMERLRATDRPTWSPTRKTAESLKPWYQAELQAPRLPRRVPADLQPGQRHARRHRRRAACERFTETAVVVAGVQLRDSTR